MMSSNNNFLLKLHMQEDENTTEIYLNKERRSFTFINDECISDLIIPEFKITSLHMILKNISDPKENDDYYAEYEQDGEIVREYDREKIELLSNLITKIKINDFLDYQKDININEYYVDNIVDAYDCVLPLEMKKILSYTTNGVVFSGDEIYYFMPHDDIVSYDGKIKHFIPFIIHEGKSYIGYDYKESLYKEYLDNKLINDGTTLEEVLNLEEVDVIGEEEEDFIEEVAFDDNEEEIIEEEIEEIEVIGEEEPVVEETIIEDVEESVPEIEKEIEVIGKEEPVVEETIMEDVEESVSQTEEEIEVIGEEEPVVEETIMEDVEESVPEIEKEIEVIGEEEPVVEEEVVLTEDEQLEKIEEDIKSAKEDLQEEIARIEQEYEETIKNIDLQFERLNNGIVQTEKKEPYQFKEKEQTKEEPVINDEIKEEIRTGVRKSLDEIEKTNDIIDEIDSDMQNVIEKAKKIKNSKKEKPVIISDEIGKEAEEILKKLNDEIANLEKAKQKAKEENIIINDEIGREAEAILAKLNAEMNKVEETKEEITEEETIISDEIGKEAEAILAKLNAEMNKVEEEQEIVEDKVDALAAEEIAKEAAMILAKLEDEAKQIEEAQAKADAKLVVVSEEIGKEAIAILEKLNKEAELINEIKENAAAQNIEISEEIGKEAEKILAKLNSEMNKVEKAKEKSEKDVVKISDAIGKEAEKILAKLNREAEKQNNETKTIVISDEIGKEAEKILAKINSEMAKVEQVKEKAEQKINISEELEKHATEILVKLEQEVKEKEKLIEETRIAKEKEKLERKKAREAKAKQDKEELINLTNLVNSSIYNGFDNYKINFNDTQKLFVEHLPYYEMPNDFSVIQIPEIEYNKLTILPDANIDLGRIKLKVERCNEDSVDFIVQTASAIVDKDGNKIKKDDSITVKLDEKMDLRLNKKQAMETWSLKIEKSTFEKEIRNIDFKKIMGLIVELDSYKELGNIEKYELQKSLMLFLNFVMVNKDFKTLEELYEIINKKTDLYEEFITKYNNKNSLNYKDSLSTYEDKKAYLTKLNYINGLIDAKWLDYPRYIYNAHNYFERDEFLDEFLDELNNNLTEHDFYDYLMGLFNEYEMFKDLDEVGRENLDKCIDYLSRLYKHNPELSEDNKYKIEKSFMIGATEEEMALLISKLCRRGIRDYAIFVEYNAEMREKYLMGELKYPVYSEYFEIEEIRNGGEYDEF